jgi:hypothetical protein
METTPELAAEGAALVRVLSTVLDGLVCANAALAAADPGQVTKFHALKAPGIGVHQYLERYVSHLKHLSYDTANRISPSCLYRIHKYASCSNECFVLALVYIDRLIQRNNFLLTELNVHRVVITAVLLAAKFFDDAYYNNAYYAKVGGVLVSEMNGLEVDFLFRINFSLHVTPELFHKYRAELVSHSAAAGVTLPELSPALHMRSSGYHGDPASMEGCVDRRTEPIPSRPMQSSEKGSVGNGNFITPSPPSTAAPSDPSSCGYGSTSTDSFPNGIAPVYPVSQPIPCHPHHQYSSGMHVASDIMMAEDQYVVVDNVAYPIMTQPATAPETGSLGKLLQNYNASAPHHRPHSHSDPSTIQHFVAGRNMLSGASGVQPA